MDTPTSHVSIPRTTRSGVLRTTRETAFGALKTILAAALVAAGFATLLALGPIPEILADAGVPDLAARIVAVLMIANGGLILVPRFTFVATIVPMSIAFFWFATGVRAGQLLVALMAIVFVFGLARLARATRPAGMSPAA